MSGPALFSLSAGWEDFLKPQELGGLYFVSSFLRCLRPLTMWDACSPASNGALPTDSTSSVACGVSTVCWGR